MQNVCRSSPSQVQPSLAGTTFRACCCAPGNEATKDTCPSLVWERSCLGTIRCTAPVRPTFGSHSEHVRQPPNYCWVALLGIPKRFRQPPDHCWAAIRTLSAVTRPLLGVPERFLQPTERFRHSPDHCRAATRTHSAATRPLSGIPECFQQPPDHCRAATRTLSAAPDSGLNRAALMGHCTQRTTICISHGQYDLCEHTASVY